MAQVFDIARYTKAITDQLRLGIEFARQNKHSVDTLGWDISCGIEHNKQGLYDLFLSYEKARQMLNYYSQRVD